MEDSEFIVEQHRDGFVAYPLGLRGVVVGQGDTYEDALADAQSATQFHLETFGNDGTRDSLGTTGPASVE